MCSVVAEIDPDIFFQVTSYGDNRTFATVHIGETCVCVVRARTWGAAAFTLLLSYSAAKKRGHIILFTRDTQRYPQHLFSHSGRPSCSVFIDFMSRHEMQSQVSVVMFAYGIFYMVRRAYIFHCHPVDLFFCNYFSMRVLTKMVPEWEAILINFHCVANGRSIEVYYSSSNSVNYSKLH